MPSLLARTFVHSLAVSLWCVFIYIVWRPHVESNILVAWIEINHVSQLTAVRTPLFGHKHITWRIRFSYPDNKASASAAASSSLRFQPLDTPSKSHSHPA
jgi:hypothetical protein